MSNYSIDPDFPGELFPAERRSLPGARTGVSQYTFGRGMGFRPLDYDFQCPNFSDWDEHLKSCGWEHVANIPQGDFEFCNFSLGIFRQKDRTKDWAGCYLIELSTEYGLEAEFFCGTILDVIELLENHFGFINRSARSLEQISENIDRLQEILCDTSTGIPAAQRFGDRQRRWREERQYREHERKLAAAAEPKEDA